MWKVVDTFKQLHLAFARNNLHSFCLKPKQVQCFEYMLRGFDVITVLPTGFGKSLLFQKVNTSADIPIVFNWRRYDKDDVLA